MFKDLKKNYNFLIKRLEFRTVKKTKLYFNQNNRLYFACRKRNLIINKPRRIKE